MVVKSNNQIGNNIVIYQSKGGALELRKDANVDTIWANQSQIADIFAAERSVVTKHIRNILNDKELDKNAVCAKFAHTAFDGKKYMVQFYNLDVVLAVGYRTNSKKAIEFRRWATRTLHEFIVSGYALNKQKIAKNYESFLKAVEDVKNLLPEHSNVSNKDVLELITFFADTWFSLDAFDKDTLTSTGRTKKHITITASKLTNGLRELKNNLISQRQASDLFGIERAPKSLEGILGNVMQSFAGKELYPTIEQKAAHLLYFIVKNHPFVDGNKRSGAYAFVWFLRNAGILDTTRLTPPALTVLTLLIAENDPKQKDKMIKLILTIISRR